MERGKKVRRNLKVRRRKRKIRIKGEFRKHWITAKK
jgi:hypothetical protein